MGEEADSRAVRTGQNQALYREVNERVRQLRLGTRWCLCR
jgi:hypothetical protein